MIILIINDNNSNSTNDTTKTTNMTITKIGLVHCAVLTSTATRDVRTACDDNNIFSLSLSLSPMYIYIYMIICKLVL